MDKYYLLDQHKKYMNLFKSIHQKLAINYEKATIKYMK
jgi:hypothetical protein